MPIAFRDRREWQPIYENAESYKAKEIKIAQAAMAAGSFLDSSQGMLGGNVLKICEQGEREGARDKAGAGCIGLENWRPRRDLVRRQQLPRSLVPRSLTHVGNCCWLSACLSHPKISYDLSCICDSTNSFSQRSLARRERIKTMSGIIS